MKFINKFLRNLAPYKVASHKVWEVSNQERKEILKLDWNEATIPPSPKVKERLKNLVEDESIFFLYPSTNNEEILQRLSMYVKLPVDNIQYFASSDSLHEYLVRMYITVGDPILILGPTYDHFRLTSQSQGAVVSFFNYNENFELDEKLFQSSINELNPSLVYICNPNNPSGNLISREFLVKIISKFPEIIFLVDEAYYEFSRESISNEVVNFPNLFVTRTFSKAFALANFRAGYLISDVNNIQQVSKIRNPKNFTTFAQEAVIGALSDIEYMEKYVSEVLETRDWFCNELIKLPFIERVFESKANFVLIRFISFDIKMLVYNQLNSKNIFVRNLLHSDMLVNTLRISIGNRMQMEKVLAEFNSIK
ncbi:MAG: histidinol-phosphate aminotransferase family protein [Bacteroidia bacterium]|nr:histidinol-phosphate aminotransferase family protein [Bacteroidia bacterium]MCF8445921.1 histidinol-phosphate aminotransferase family protein [Bacteroidia bacterium]